MFQTEIGPTGMTKGYLRPETAQKDVIQNVTLVSKVFNFHNAF